LLVNIPYKSVKNYVLQLPFRLKISTIDTLTGFCRQLQEFEDYTEISGTGVSCL
jgi:hypothetical protein